MRRALRILPGLLLLLTFAAGQRPPIHEHDDEHSLPQMPGGKDLKEEMLKAEHAKSIKDAELLISLSQELHDELEKNTRFVLSVSAIKKTEEIEKVAKRIRSRMRR
jgi:hypothetical protein